MISQQEMIDAFGQEDLIYAIPERLLKIDLPQESKGFILNTGFPYVIDYFRFSMDFESISEDIEIGESVKNLNHLFTIGCQSPTPLVGRMVHLSEIGLDRNASLSDIGKRMRSLGIEYDDDIILSSEVTQSYRICLNVKNQGEIISIIPKDLSIIFLNSSIQQLAASLIAYSRNILSEKDFGERIENFQKELTRIDSKALASEENLWSSIIERLIRDSEGY
ncbi:SUKH-4 family immunity protein [Nostoc sp. UIC 10890]